MKPGSNLENPTIIVEPKDLELSMFGMAGGPQLLSQERNDFYAVLKEVSQDPDSNMRTGGYDYATRGIEIPSHTGNIALLGAAMEYCAINQDERFGGDGVPAAGSVTEARMNTERQIIADAIDALIVIAGGKEAYEEAIAQGIKSWETSSDTA